MSTSDGGTSSACSSRGRSHHGYKYKSTAVWCSLLLVASCHVLYERHLVPYFRWLNLSSSTAPSSSADDDDQVMSSMLATTYYPRDCRGGGGGVGGSGGGPVDVSTSNITNIILDPPSNDHRDTEIILRHGAVVLPDLLPSSTSSRLRDVIVKMNANQPKKEQFFVLQHANRHSLRMGIHDAKLDPDSILPDALARIASSPTLNRLLVDLLGPDPALVELTAITSSYGAASQHWHADTPPYGSAGRFGRTYTDIYTVLVFLQDTTASMGATALCPGTQLCTDFSHGTCDELGFQVSPVTAGTAVMYNSELRHRGMAHVDPTALDRVGLLLSFTTGPKESGGRKLPMGSTYNLRWDLWGHTLSDLQELGGVNAKEESSSLSSWGPRHALGLRLREDGLQSSSNGPDGSHRRRRKVRGWSFPAYVSTSCASPDDWDYCTVVDVSDGPTVRGLFVAIELVLLVAYLRLIVAHRRGTVTGAMAGAKVREKKVRRGAGGSDACDNGTSTADGSASSRSTSTGKKPSPASSIATKTTTAATVEEERRSTTNSQSTPNAAAAEGGKGSSTTTTTTTKVEKKKKRRTTRTVVVTSQTTTYPGGGRKRTTTTTTSYGHGSTDDDVGGFLGRGQASFVTLSACHALLALVTPLALFCLIRLQWVDDLTPPPRPPPLPLDLPSVPPFTSPTGNGSGGETSLPEGSRRLNARDLRRDDVLFGVNYDDVEEGDGRGGDFLYAHRYRLHHAHPGNREFVSTLREHVLASPSLGDDSRSDEDSTGDDDENGDGEEHRTRVSALVHVVLGDERVRDRRFVELRWRRIVPPRDGDVQGAATEWVVMDRRTAVERTEAVVTEELRRLRGRPPLYLSKNRPIPLGVAGGDVGDGTVGSSSFPIPREGANLMPATEQDL